jgi:hypothetical protein
MIIIQFNDPLLYTIYICAYYFKLLRHNLKYLYFKLFTLNIRHTEFVVIFKIYFHKSFFAITMKLKAKIIFRAAAIFVF